MAIQHRKATDDPTMACEDLKFFEKRVTEVIGFMGPSCTRWRISVVLCLAIVAVFISKYFASERWEYLQIPFFFINFTTSVDIMLCMSLVFLMVVVFGAHRRIVAPTIIARRCREALSPFSLSCDHNGKLIVRLAQRTPSANP